MSEYDWDQCDSEVERRWAEEIRRRIRAYRAGEMTTIPIEVAQAEVDRLLAGSGDPVQNR